MEKRNNKKSAIILSILGILSLVLITAGVTYAVFTYTKLGETENTITTGTLRFLYTENTGVGNGISITNALPVSDTVGKAYSTEGYVFDFTIEGANSGTEAIPYEITLRKKATSTLDEDVVKVYLTDRTTATDVTDETVVLTPTLYNALTATTVDVGDNVEKTLYKTTVPAQDLTYAKNYRLRMWITEEADFSATGTDPETEAPVYPYNGETFIGLVNVYANVPTVVSGE